MPEGKEQFKQALEYDSGGVPVTIVDVASEIPVTGNVTLAGSNATQAVAVMPNDATVIPVTKGLYIGVSGNVVVTMANGQDATFTGLASGMIHPISVTKVRATGTTATNILAVY